MAHNKLIFLGIMSGGLVTTYPNPLTFLKLIICVLIGIAIWSAISRPVKKRTVLEKVSDYFGQIVLSLVSAYIIKKYVNLESDFEFLLAGFISGLLSYGILIFYRWVTSSGLTNLIRDKIKDKLK